MVVSHSSNFIHRDGRLCELSFLVCIVIGLTQRRHFPPNAGSGAWFFEIAGLLRRGDILRVAVVAPFAYQTAAYVRSGDLIGAIVEGHGGEWED